MTVQTPPGAVVIHGIFYLRDAKSNLVPVDNVRPMDLLMDEMVRKIAGYGEDLSAELSRFAVHTDADIAAFDALLDQEYNITPAAGAKGNRSFTTFDGLMMVKVAVSDRIVLGPELQAAQAVLDALISERGEGVDPFLITLVKRAFKCDQEGKVDVRAILALRRMEVDDPRWADFTRAIDDAVRVVGSKRYLRIYRRDKPDGQWRMIPLDLAAVEPSPAAFERGSLRRQVEELGAKIERAAEQLSLAQTYAEDGAMATMLGCLDAAREILGATLGALDLTHPGAAGAFESAYVRRWLVTVPQQVLAESLGFDVAQAVIAALGEG